MLGVRCFVFALSLSGALVAQRTWVVDALGTGDFTDIPPALSAAAPGDTVVVRPGGYTPGATSKGLRIIGGSLVYLFDGEFVVENLPVDQRFSMSGFRSGFIRLRLNNNRGRLHFEDLVFDPLFGSRIPESIPSNAVTVRHCTHVSFNRCAWVGGPAVFCGGSTVVFTSCELFGRGVSAGHSGTTQPALRTAISTVRLAETSLRGGGGASSITYTAAPPAPAIEMNGGHLRIAGSSATFVQSGVSSFAGPFNDGWSTWAIDSDQGVVEIDPDVRLNPFEYHPPTLGSSTFVTVEIPSMTADGVAPGDTISPTLTASAGHAAAMFVSAPAEPRFALFDELWLDLSTTVPIGVVVMPPSETWINPQQIHAAYFSPGDPLCFQSATLDPNGVVAFSTPVEVVLE